MIGIVCALKCEADNLIDNFQLKSYPRWTAYPVFYDERIFLIVSGLGKLHAAGATMYLASLMGDPNLAWLNVGIGGHRTLEIGKGVLAHQIKDGKNGPIFYPMFTWKLSQMTASVMTVEKVEMHYEEECVFEMEASGFFQSASRFSTAEFIHSYKIISDNLTQPPIQNAKFVRELLLPHLPQITSIIEILLSQQKDLVDAHALSDPLEPFLERWHFTTTQQHQLRRYLQCWHALSPGVSIWDEKLQVCRGAKELLLLLNLKIKNVSVHLH